MKYKYHGKTVLECPVFNSSDNVMCDELVFTADDIMKIRIATTRVDRNRFFDWLGVVSMRFHR